MSIEPCHEFHGRKPAGCRHPDGDGLGKVGVTKLNGVGDYRYRLPAVAPLSELDLQVEFSASEHPRLDLMLSAEAHPLEARKLAPESPQHVSAQVLDVLGEIDEQVDVLGQSKVGQPGATKRRSAEERDAVAATAPISDRSIMAGDRRACL
jgi:hypothetical protein